MTISILMWKVKFLDRYDQPMVKSPINYKLP